MTWSSLRPWNAEAPRLPAQLIAQTKLISLTIGKTTTPTSRSIPSPTPRIFGQIKRLILQRATASPNLNVDRLSSAYKLGAGLL